jgi:hypothetical protein
MTTKELRVKITEAQLSEWFQTVEVIIKYPHIDYSIKLQGLSSIHSWLSKQVKGWESYELLPEELAQSKRHFINSKKRIENFLYSNIDRLNESDLNNNWRQELNQLRNNSNIFTADSPQTEFLVDVFKNKPNSFKGAYGYITGSYRASNQNDFIGSLLAYEFDSKDFSEIVNRRNKEKSSISRIRNKFEEQLIESENDLVEHIKNSTKSYQDYIKTIDNFTENKKQLFNNWFTGNEEKKGIKSEFDAFFKETNGRRENLEIAYDKKLELSKPARYWRLKSTSYFENYITARTILLILIGVSALLLGIILITAPDYIFKNVFKGNEITIVRWSLVFIAFLALMAFAIKAVSKVMFSSLHLSRDAEERHALTFVYLSLLNEQGTDMDSKDRQLILQSLFSRTDTGLLKDDSGPTMPNDFLSKVMNK